MRAVEIAQKLNGKGNSRIFQADHAINKYLETKEAIVKNNLEIRTDLCNHHVVGSHVGGQ
jgi:hypothetical protein